MSTGNVDQALRETDDAFALSKALDHPYSTSVAYLGASLSMRFLGLSDAQQKYTAAGIDLCESWGLKAWLPILTLSRASLATRQPDHEAVEMGVEDILEAYKIWTNAGAGTFSTWFHYEVASAKLALGDFDVAEEYLKLARQACHECDDHWLEADIYRLEASLKEKTNCDPGMVSAAYAGAEYLARNLGTKLAGLKTSVDHARFLCKIGDRSKALGVLRDADTIIDTSRRLSIHDETKSLLKELS